MARTPHLNVNELFGATTQGEGRMAGQLASFLRLTGCNLSCSWCDTPYTWDWTRFDHSVETTRMSVDEVAERLAEMPGRIVVTGGEPLMQASALTHLLKHPRLAGREFDLETNGTRPLRGTAGLWANVSCSPKIIPSSGQPDASTIPLGAAQPELLASADFKFVVQSEADLQAVDAWVAEHPEVSRSRIWLMPEGTDHPTLTSRTPWLMTTCVERGYNFSSRLHVYGWADVRGH